MLECRFPSFLRCALKYFSTDELLRTSFNLLGKKEIIFSVTFPVFTSDDL